MIEGSGWVLRARAGSKSRDKGGEGRGREGMWKERLKELGVFVANALIEMGDLGAAARHLETLRPRDGGRMRC